MRDEDVERLSPFIRKYLGVHGRYHIYSDPVVAGGETWTGGPQTAPPTSTPSDCLSLAAPDRPDPA